MNRLASSSGAGKPPSASNISPRYFGRASSLWVRLQLRLLMRGYAQVGQADGFYGDQTRAAVLAFQQAGGLPASGDVDCATWAALLEH